MSFYKKLYADWKHRESFLISKCLKIYPAAKLLNGKVLTTFTLKSGQKMSLSPFLVSVILEVLEVQKIRK